MQVFASVCKGEQVFESVCNCTIVKVYKLGGVQMCYYQKHLIIHSPYIAGYRTHHSGLCLRRLNTGVGQQGAVLLEQESALDPVCVRLESKLGYSHTGKI